MSPPGPLKQSSQNPIFIQNLNFFTFFLDTKSNTSCASAALTQALRKRLIPPKRSLQSFLKLKKIGVSHQNRAIKKKSRKTEKTAILTPISLSLFLFIYIWYIDLDSAYQHYCIESCFSFSLNKLDVILFVTLCMWYKKMEQQ